MDDFTCVSPTQNIFKTFLLLQKFPLCPLPVNIYFPPPSAIFWLLSTQVSFTCFKHYINEFIHELGSWNQMYWFVWLHSIMECTVLSGFFCLTRCFLRFIHLTVCRSLFFLAPFIASFQQYTHDFAWMYHCVFVHFFLLENIGVVFLLKLLWMKLLSAFYRSFCYHRTWYLLRIGLGVQWLDHSAKGKGLLIRSFLIFLQVMIPLSLPS
jgi:hypothetical protein